MCSWTRNTERERRIDMPQVIASTYELMEKIGSGGGGTVYLAQHLRLKKKVVLKADKRKLTVSQAENYNQPGTAAPRG